MLVIPYSPIQSFHIAGPISIHPFGFLVVFGVYMGYLYVHHLARKRGLSEHKAEGSVRSVLIPGFIMAHIIEILFYQSYRLESEGWMVIFKIWDGISSYGGFLGALLGFLAYGAYSLKKDTPRYADILMEGLTVGWVFGRLACTVAMDHPGAISDSFFAFEQPGGARHNLGFYEFLFTVFVLVPAMLWLQRKKTPPGTMTAMLCLLYAPVRFVMDAFRSTDSVHSDPRYWGLTFAQYCSLALGVFALHWLYRLRKQATSSAA